MQPTLEQDYRRRFDRVVDHILEHLPERLTVRRLAAVAHFSPFHFHRLFQALVGESVKAFITRVRLERALRLRRLHPQRALKEIAAECGFRSAAVFTRTFRRVYGQSPSEVQLLEFLHERGDRSAFPLESRYYLREFPADEQPLPVAVEARAGFDFAYLRVVNSYGGEGMPIAYGRVLEWARSAGLHAGNAALIGMSQDDPEVTPLAKCRYDLGLAVPPGVAIPPDFSRRRFPARTSAVARCVGDLHEADRVWNYLFKMWLPRSRWQPAHLPAYEVFRVWETDPVQQVFDLDCVVPLAPL
ncbi:MAG: AraC family transcriptional regulator [Verrucomicrobia bacterium]|nr:AraC family transcriptional regulator [Verrucomicrobiota bacterium]